MVFIAIWQQVDKQLGWPVWLRRLISNQEDVSSNPTTSWFFILYQMTSQFRHSCSQIAMQNELTEDLSEKFKIWNRDR